MKLLLMLEVETKVSTDKTQESINAYGMVLAHSLNIQYEGWEKFECKKVELVEETKPV